MVQLGWNAGPRHAHIWGLAKSYMKNLGEEMKAEHDKDAVALMSLCWNIAKATLLSRSYQAHQGVARRTQFATYCCSWCS
jgi:hypothetical protein